MRKKILLLTLSGLVLGISALKLIERSPGQRGVKVALLDVTDRSISKPAEAPRAVEAVPAPVMVAAEKVERTRPSPVVVAVVKQVKAETVVVSKNVSKSGNLNQDEAVMIALKSVPGEVGKVEYKKGHYKVRIHSGEGRRAKVYVHAGSGEVTRIKMKS